MEPEYELLGNTLIVYVPKELDDHIAGKVKVYSEEMMKTDKVKNIIFDFNDTTFMDSSGIGMMMGRYRAVQKRNGFVGVKSVGAPIHRILEISGLYKLVEICE
ncbi:MAG: anti-sigma factor antagonist [Lachnospiraceae bacterium]|nr:anti-sigma factor antagonist [Lachnospiraceae bacterium]